MINELTNEAIDREVLLYAVQRKIFCDITGKILDVRDAVLLTATKGDKVVANIVMNGDVWDAGKDDTLAKVEELGATAEIIDGRDYA